MKRKLRVVVEDNVDWKGLCQSAIHCSSSTIPFVEREGKISQMDSDKGIAITEYNFSS